MKPQSTPAPPARAAAELPAAVLGCLIACRRCADAAEALAPEQYARRVPGHHSIGEHLRHCVEHFQLLFRGLDLGVVDYDARERDPELETDPRTLLAALASIAERLEALDERALGVSLTIRVLASPGREPVLVESTLGRELSFLSSHNIHHIALMGMLAESMGIALPKDLGLAYSTAEHRARS